MNCNHNFQRFYNFADVAWLLTSSSPSCYSARIVFFYGGMVERKCNFYDVTKFYITWCGEFTLGCCRILVFFGDSLLKLRETLRNNWKPI